MNQHFLLVHYYFYSLSIIIASLCTASVYILLLLLLYILTWLIILNSFFYLFFSFPSGISSLTFTKAGEAMYLHSSSELQRISLSAMKITKAHCAVVLPPNARSAPEVIEEPSEKKEEASEDVVDTEAEAQESQPQAEPKTITENGVSGSSEFI